MEHRVHRDFLGTSDLFLGLYRALRDVQNKLEGVLLLGARVDRKAAYGATIIEAC